MARIDRVVLTCEHGGNRVPPAYARYFVGAGRVLGSHRGYDVGALELARGLSRRLGVRLEAATVSRLLVDLNRSPGHRYLFSEFLDGAPEKDRCAVVSRYYLPHRKRVEDLVLRRLNGGSTVLHLAVHSFTPVLNGKKRRADVGLLYDPSCAGERDFCARWRKELGKVAPWLCVRRNYPYRGRADGLGTYLRKQVHSDAYLAVEVEVNQVHLVPRARTKAVIAGAIARSLSRALGRAGRK